MWYWDRLSPGSGLQDPLVPIPPRHLPELLGRLESQALDAGQTLTHPQLLLIHGMSHQAWLQTKALNLLLFVSVYCQLRARRVLSIFKDVLLRTRRRLLLCSIYGKNALLVYLWIMIAPFWLWTDNILIQWNLVIKRSDITKPSYNKVTLSVLLFCITMSGKFGPNFRQAIGMY